MRAVLWACCCLLAACPPPADVTPQITVHPWGPRGYALLPHAAGPPSKGARAHVMHDGEQLGGPNAIGRPGDLILENDEVVFVIDRLGASAGFAESGGNLVDAADARARKDELGQLFTYFGVFPRQGVYDVLTSDTRPDGSAWVEARGHELYEPKLVVTTRYTLKASDRAVLLETFVENAGDTPVELAALGDAIQWGGAEKVAPGEPVGFKGDTDGPFVGGLGRFVSYAVASTDGDLAATSGRGWTDTLQRKAVKLAPHARTSYARVFVVGERPDTASLVTELMLAAGQKVGALDVDLRPEPGVSSAELLPDARLSVRDPSGAERMTIRAPSARFGAYLPPGHWTLAYAGAGGPAAPPVSVDIAPDTAAHAAFTVGRPARAEVGCVDAVGAPTPCKLTFERTDAAPAPDFGPPYVAGPARNQAASAGDRVDVKLAPGPYRITASRGPEYALASSEVTFAPGQRVDIRLSPRRVVDTRGYLGCDFHQHTMLGTDSPVSTRDRVIANAAEGVEVAVASEHNLVADFEPIVRDLHLTAELVSISGDELTSDASVHPWGHANAWPLPFDAGKVRGGAPAVRDRLASDLFDELRRTVPSPFVLQINHPRSGRSGYFDLTEFDPISGVGSRAGYDGAFDALEVWNGRNVEERARVLLDFFGLLRAGRPVTPTADTDTHGIVGQEAGYPRTYVRVTDDAHLDAWDGDRTAELVTGVKVLRDVVLTNGPMLRVTANGAPIGGVARGRAVKVEVHVETAPWVIVDEVRVVRAVASPEERDRRTVDLKPLPSGALGADLTFTLSATRDDAFVVIARGVRSMSPVVPGPGAEETSPWAMTGAFWIDADGDGRALGQRAGR